MVANAAMQRRITGQPDSRGAQGIAARGANVYNGGSMSAHSGGGPQFGRPPMGPPNSPPVGMANGNGLPMGGEPGMAPVQNPMAPILQNMQQLSDVIPSPSGETDNPVMAAMRQAAPPGPGGVGGNPTNVSPEIMAAIVRKLGAGNGGI